MNIKNNKTQTMSLSNKRSKILTKNSKTKQKFNKNKWKILLINNSKASNNKYSQIKIPTLKVSTKTRLFLNKLWKT